MSVSRERNKNYYIYNNTKYSSTPIDFSNLEI